LPKPSPRLGVDVNLFDLEGSHDVLQALSKPGPELGLLVPEVEPAHAGPSATQAEGADRELPSLDFSLPASAVPQANPPPPFSPSAIELDLTSYLSGKDSHKVKKSS
jgi:hypothetical protein